MGGWTGCSEYRVGDDGSVFPSCSTSQHPLWDANHGLQVECRVDCCRLRLINSNLRLLCALAYQKQMKCGGLHRVSAEPPMPLPLPSFSYLDTHLVLRALLILINLFSEADHCADGPVFSSVASPAPQSAALAYRSA